MSEIEHFWGRSTLVNIVASIAVLSTVGYAVWKGDTELLKMISLPAIGWLLKEVKD